MKQLGDKLVKSPICNSDACYESEFQMQELKLPKLKKVEA